MKSSMINFHDSECVNQKPRVNQLLGGSEQAGWLLGHCLKSCPLASVTPTQACIYGSIKKILSWIFQQGMWHWIKPCWFSLPSTANFIFLTENIPDRLAFQVSRDFHTHANSAVLHYLFKEGEANEKKLNSETEIYRKEPKLASKFIGSTCNRKQSHY